jgi:hypothetical protein
MTPSTEAPSKEYIMSPEFYNLYVEKLVNEVSELNKSKIIVAAQVAWLEKINADLNEKLAAAEERISKLESERSGSSKAKKKEEDSSESF